MKKNKQTNEKNNSKCLYEFQWVFLFAFAKINLKKKNRKIFSRKQKILSITCVYACIGWFQQAYASSLRNFSFKQNKIN
jgi:hypothetical protein